MLLCLFNFEPYKHGCNSREHGSVEGMSMRKSDWLTGHGACRKQNNRNDQTGLVAHARVHGRFVLCHFLLVLVLIPIYGSVFFQGSPENWGFPFGFS